MKVTKDNAMLIDVQHVKSRKRGEPDYLYIIYKNLDNNEKYLEAIPDPKMTIYFEKPEFRNHKYNKSYCELTKLTPVTVRERDIPFKIAEDMGEKGQAALRDIFNTKNYSALRDFFLYPYSFGADVDIRSWYRMKWRESMDNNRIKPLTLGFLDIEVDIMENGGNGDIDPVFNPIDLVTFIDSNTKTSYTFALIGTECPEKDTSNMTEDEKRKEIERRELYKGRLEQHEKWSSDPALLDSEAHKLFDEDYPDMTYKFFFYKDEAKMLVHLFELINSLKLDMIMVYNIAFDIPFIINRLEVLGLDPKEVMCHKDFPVKKCYFKTDEHTFSIKEKSHFFYCSSYTVWIDQMVNYAAIRKGGKELRSNKLDYIASIEIGDKKLDYAETGYSIRYLSYRDYLTYVLYNIKDVLLQMAIEEKTSDADTTYLSSYSNITSYENIFKQTNKLRNVQIYSYYQQGLIVGNNVNAIINGKHSSNDNDEDGNGENKKEKFDGAVVGEPKLIDNFGEKMYGKRTNNHFAYSIDMDMSAFYPSTIEVMNIDASTLIFKMIVPPEQYDVRGGDLKYRGITDTQMFKENKDTFTKDIGKEIMDNYQTKNYLSFGYKWLNLPGVDEVYKELCKRLGE